MRIIKEGSYAMILPDKVFEASKRKEEKNYKFRSFLKAHADEKELDEQFLRLHNELFKDYDCSKCRNCCKVCHAQIPESDIEKDAEFLNMTAEKFKEEYLIRDEFGELVTKHMPCDFLDVNGECRLGDCKPESCKKYPFTNQPERLWSLLGLIESVSVCPVAYEICERLKQEYHFR